MEELIIELCPFHKSDRYECDHPLCRYFSLNPDPAWPDECKLDSYSYEKLLKIKRKKGENGKNG